MSSREQSAVYIAIPALVWSAAVYLVQSVGIYKMYAHLKMLFERRRHVLIISFNSFRSYSYPPRDPISPSLPEEQIPHITIIRPVKGLEPELYACLVSTFRQTYPRSRLSIRFCVSSEDDPAYPVLEQVVQEYSDKFDVTLLVEEYDPVISSLQGKTGRELGPNPKIRNISRAYREAIGDIIWIIDCNVWISKGVAGRMVDKLMGYLPHGQHTTPYRFVHQMPIEVDIPSTSTTADATPQNESLVSRILRLGGGRLDEMFMATSHAKLYGAINAVGVVPCIIGKSNMFRKSHLDRYTNPKYNHNLTSQDANRGRGIDFFSSFICEDHLIGDLLWKANIPGFRRHGLVWGDLAIQPMAGMSVALYCARRVRWLRARKFTVLVATLVEPGVESLLCNLAFAYAATTLPFFKNIFSIPPTWRTMGLLWLMGVTIWMACDRAVFRRLHRCHAVKVDENTPSFAAGSSAEGRRRRPMREWLPAWLGRELLAFPIWTWAVLLGRTVKWRGKSFKVRTDMSVYAVDPEECNEPLTKEENATQDDLVEQEYQHPDAQEVPKWNGRPTARQRKTRP